MVDGQIMVRVPFELKEQAMRVARAEGKTLSQVVRDLLESYLQERDIRSYAEALWSRIERDFASRGIKEADVEKAIRWVRDTKNQG